MKYPLLWCMVLCSLVLGACSEEPNDLAPEPQTEVVQKPPLATQPAANPSPAPGPTHEPRQLSFDPHLREASVLSVDEIRQYEAAVAAQTRALLQRAEDGRLQPGRAFGVAAEQELSQAMRAAGIDPARARNIKQEINARAGFFGMNQQGNYAFNAFDQLSDESEQALRQAFPSIMANRRTLADLRLEMARRVKADASESDTGSEQR